MPPSLDEWPDDIPISTSTSTYGYGGPDGRCTHEPLMRFRAWTSARSSSSPSRWTRGLRCFRRRRATCSNGSPSWPTSRYATSRSTGGTVTSPGGSTADLAPVAPRSSGCTAGHSSVAIWSSRKPTGSRSPSPRGVRRALARLPQVAARRALPGSVRRRPRRVAVGHDPRRRIGCGARRRAPRRRQRRRQPRRGRHQAAARRCRPAARRRSCSCTRSSTPELPPLPPDLGEKLAGDEAASASRRRWSAR